MGLYLHDLVLRLERRWMEWCLHDQLKQLQLRLKQNLLGHLDQVQACQVWQLKQNLLGHLDQVQACRVWH